MQHDPRPDAPSPTDSPSTDPPGGTPPGSSASEPGGLRARWSALRRHRAGRWAIDLTLFALVFAALSFYQTRNLISSGEAAPVFEIFDHEGARVQSEDFAGKPTLLYFWAPWCGVCKVQSSVISRLHAGAGERYRVASIVVDHGGPERLARTMQEQGVDYPVLLGGQGIARMFNVSSFPTMYVLDAEGHITHTVIGYTPWLTLRARLWLAGI